MLQTAPVLLLFHPTEGPDAKADGQPSRFDFNTGYVVTGAFKRRVFSMLIQGRVSNADPIHTWISRHLPSIAHPPIVRPINYVKIVTTVVAVLGGLTFVTVAAPYILPVIQNRNLWAAISLIAVLLFTSGHMYNHIRKVPYVAGDGKGGVSYFAGGFQNQFGLETQIVAAMCMSSTGTLSASLTNVIQTAFWRLPPSLWPSKFRAWRTHACSKSQCLSGGVSFSVCTAFC